MNNAHYFLGSSSSAGFKTPIKEILNDTDNTVYILKGTPGSGKSTLMKKISEAFSEIRQDIYHCSADPDSLDAVYLTDKKALIIDGTAPHCIDPEYPKAVQTIVDIGAYIEAAKLRSKKNELIALTDEYSDCHKRCRSCLSAASSVIDDIMVSADSILHNEKLDSFTERFIKRILPKNSDSCGKLITRQRSAVTMNGCSAYLPESGKIYLLKDDNISGAARFLEKAAKLICERGYTVQASRCYLSKTEFIEHITVPEADIHFITSNCINSLNVPETEKEINFRRFYDSKALRDNDNIKQRIKFGKRACAEFLKESAAALIDAKSIHDKIESYYISAADFDGIGRLAYKLISDIRSL